MNEQIRAEFEKYYCQTEGVPFKEIQAGRIAESYRSPHMDRAWDLWQAAQAGDGEAAIYGLRSGPGEAWDRETTVKANDSWLHNPESLIPLYEHPPAQPKVPDEYAALLKESAELFRFYERSHRVRGPEHLEKANRNAEIAGRIEAMLSAQEQGK
jgi:hypothetical protein